MTFEFDAVSEQVKITPMKYLFCEKIMKRFKKDLGEHIIPNYCFSNAVIAAEWFNERGFDVEVVEGRFQSNDYTYTFCEKNGLRPISGKMRLVDNPIEHRWCKKGDKYFDPTLELNFGFEMTKTVDYDAMRIYDADTLMDYALELKDRFGEMKFCDSITGLTYAYVGGLDIPINWGYINENFEYVAPDKNPVEVRAELFKNTIKKDMPRFNRPF